MKKTLVAAILGLAVGAVSSYGQGSMAFQTYTSHGGSGLLTTFAANVPGHASGTDAVDGGYTAGLLYSLAPIVDSSVSGAPLAGGWTDSGLTAVFGANGTAPGFFAGTANFVLNPYVAGTTVYFQVIAWQTADGSYGASDVRGKSSVFTSTLATGIDQPPTMDNLLGFQVVLVPEPTTLALAGLGLASLLVARRRK